MTLDLNHIIEIIGCEVYGPEDFSSEINHVLFDSRSLTHPADTLFCAFTSKSADGHRFIPELYGRGVRKFLVERVPTDRLSMPDAVFLKVSDIYEALDKIAADCRGRLKTVVAITGSAGKTVVKELIYKASLSAEPKMRLWRSPRSWNTRLGVPMSIIEADSAADVAVFEVGIDSAGDMEAHARMLRPDIGVLTSITAEHDPGFKSRTEKITEKLKLFADASTVIYDGSDDEVERVVDETLRGKKLIAVRGSSARQLDGRLAWTLLRVLGADQPEVPDEDPLNRIDLNEGVNNCVILYDNFTNDLRSLRWALDFMHRRHTPSRTSTLILSDLLHGACTEPELTTLYSELGQLLEAFKIDRLVAIGPELKKFGNLIPPNIVVENVSSPSDFLLEFDSAEFSNETVLIAGSPKNEFIEIKKALDSPRHDSIFELNLDALVHNYNHYRAMLRETTAMVAMIKASAYGTGALEVAKTISAQGVDYFAVAVIDEGMNLRHGGITTPIMVLNPVTTNYRALFRYGLEPSVFSLRELDILLDEARRAGIKSFNAHIKLDTGMHRVGFTANEIPELVQKLKETPELHVASVFSHLATADCPELRGYTETQLKEFDRLSAQIADSLAYPVKRHILNTAGIVAHPDHQHDMVRLGIGLYGVDPFGSPELRPVASLKTTIISIKHWPKGTPIGYGCSQLTERDSVVATLPLGYADGIDRRLSRGAASFLVRGIECPTLGNICMDQCMIDITDVPDAQIGDEVEIFGNNIAVEKLAATLGTIPYEILTSISPRVQRVYFRD